MENTKNEMEFTKKVWDSIIDYEKSWMKSYTNSQIPTVKILDYFGAERICKLFGCSIVRETIARELIYEAFK